jgi:microsomal dipeptidase-like Zn-dependent dipeptidase
MGSVTLSGKMGSSTLLVVLSLLALFPLSIQRAFAQAQRPSPPAQRGSAPAQRGAAPAQNTSAGPTYNQIKFVIQTGDDDLRGNSTATATLQAANGSSLQVIQLKAQNQPAWNNNSSHTVTVALNPPRPASAIAHIVIALQSHNSFGQTDDNWNVQSVTVTLTGNGVAPKELMSFSGAPLARLTGSKPSFSIPEEGTGAAGTFNGIQFVVKTGGDDLRGNSSASLTLESPNGTTLQQLTLHAQNSGSWDNNSTHTVSLELKPPRKPCDIGHIAITLTSHNGFGETDDNWNVESINVTLTNNGVGQQEWGGGSGDPLQRLTGSLPTLVLDGPDCMANAIPSEPATGKLRGFVDLHTHPLSNLGFGGKVIYGGVDIGALLPADPDCHKNVRAANMQQALGHDGSTHGSFGVGVGIPVAGMPGSVGVSNSCGDALRELIIHNTQTGTQGAANESSDAHGAPDFKEWPVWNDITHQKMWVDWIHRAYLGGLRVMVALAVNNKTIGDMTSGPGDYPTDDKDSADKQIAETKAFVLRHKDFMEVASSSADLERIVRSNKLAVVIGVEIDNIGNFNIVNPLTNAEISAEINRLYSEGVRYIFPIHLIDNRFGGTALYEDLFNYSNDREAGHWWAPTCAMGINYKFKSSGGVLFTAGVLAKLGAVFNAPNYPACQTGYGQVNSLGLTPQGQFAIREMMRHGMLIDIDHMSDKSQNMTIVIAKAVPGGYPLNSGHSQLRTTGGNERNMSAVNYQAIGALHGMAALGTADMRADQFVTNYNQMFDALSSGASGPIIAFGTDTDGMAMGMPPRSGSAVHYDDNFPRSSAGTKWWDYNKDGVAHYGLIPDFLKDVHTLPAPGGYPLSGAQLVDNNLMQGADYFLQTWQKCEQLKTKVPAN